MRRGPVLTVATVVVLLLGLGVASARSVASLHPPQTLRATAIGDTLVTLTWDDANTRESGYEVARSTDSTSGFVVVARPRRNQTTTTVTSLTPATTYYFTVRARGRQQQFSVAQPLRVRTTGDATPDAEPSTTTTTSTSAPTTTSTIAPVATTTTTTVPAPTAEPDSQSWVQARGGVGSDVGRAVAVDGMGSVVVAGTFTGTANLGTGPLTDAGGGDLFLAKYTAGGTPQWSKRFGGTGTDSPHAVAIDRSANCDGAGGTDCIVVTGLFVGTANFGGASVTSVGSYDIFLAKYSATGAHLWSKRFGNAYDDIGEGVAVDGAGDVLLTGVFGSRADFGGGELASPYYDQDAFVAKFSPAGAHLWSRNWSNTSRDWATGIAVDANDDVAITGMFMGAIDFGFGQMRAGAEDIFVAKLAGTDGHALWARRFGGGDVDRGAGIAFAPGGNMVIAGTIYNGTVDFGGGAMSSGYQQIGFVVELSGGTGTHVWSKRIGNSDACCAFHSAAANSVAVGSDGNVTVTGWFDGTVDFGGGPFTATGNNAQYPDAFVAQYSQTGAHRWSRHFGGRSRDFGTAVAADAATNDVIATGSFGLTADFDGTTLTSAGNDDMYLVRTRS